MPTQILLVHCGRLSVEKRADRSIDAVAALCAPVWTFGSWLPGEGQLRTSLERQAGLPVDFTGFISSRRTVAGLLASADVALAPGPHETFGLPRWRRCACTDNDPVAIAGAVSRIGSRPAQLRRSGAPSISRGPARPPAC